MELPNSHNAHLRGPGFLTTCFLGLCLRVSPHRQPPATCRHEGTRARSIRAIWTGPASAITKLPRVGDGGEAQQSQPRRRPPALLQSEACLRKRSRTHARGTELRAGHGAAGPTRAARHREETLPDARVPRPGATRRSRAVHTAPRRGRGRRLSAPNHSRSRVAARLSQLLPHSAADGAAATEPRTRRPGTCEWLPGPASVRGPGLVARPQCNPSAPASQR